MFGEAAEDAGRIRGDGLNTLSSSLDTDGEGAAERSTGLGKEGKYFYQMLLTVKFLTIPFSELSHVKHCVALAAPSFKTDFDVRGRTACPCFCKLARHCLPLFLQSRLFC